MPSDPRIAATKAAVDFRSNLEDVINVLGAFCQPGHSVEDLLGILKEAQRNDMLLQLLMDKFQVFIEGRPSG